MSEKNIEIILRSYDAQNAGDFDKAVLDFRTDFVHRTGADPCGPRHGAGAYRELMASGHRVMPCTHTTELAFAQGDLVAVRHNVRGRHIGTFLGIPATGREVTMTSNDIYRVVDGKVVEEWTEFSALDLLRQLGVFSIPGGR